MRTVQGQAEDIIGMSEGVGKGGVIEDRQDNTHRGENRRIKVHERRRGAS